MSELHERIIYEPGEGEITEKKSRFIGAIRSIETEEEALAFLAERRRLHYNARHNCFAFVLGEHQELARMSDDGEPQGTAGKPMLDVLLGENIHNAVIVVTRYFGGILLGTGGLVRAYQQAAKAAIGEAIVVEKLPGVRGTLRTDYSGIGKIKYIMRTLDVLEISGTYTEAVEVDFMAPEGRCDEFLNKVTEVTAGQAVIRNLRPMYYGDALGECVLF